MMRDFLYTVYLYSSTVYIRKQLAVKHGSRDRYLIQVNLDERAQIRLDLIDVLPLQSLAFSKNTACGLALDELDRDRRD
jgi:hypothetical protein